MTVFSTPHRTEPLGVVTEPVFALAVQGAKRSILGDRVFDYHAGQYLVAAADLPLTSQVTYATPTEPFLGLGLALEPEIITRLLLEAGSSPLRRLPGPAIATSDADIELLDAVVRLLRLTDEPRDITILAPGVRREIHWRLLNGPQADSVRQIGLADCGMSLIARAITWIKKHYDEAIRIDDLADQAGMSVSSFNRHFRAVTAMSPLQYQKQLRLQEARIRLIRTPHDVAAIGYAIGYNSPSQFSREYRRMFGASPSRDAIHLQVGAAVKEEEAASTRPFTAG
ncbi:MAG: AraC family transcriptional regulator [Catenulispora sp.]|nr:AraC family transcriptional regulator [Catenulispora sp.]